MTITTNRLFCRRVTRVNRPHDKQQTMYQQTIRRATERSDYREAVRAAQLEGILRSPAERAGDAHPIRADPVITLRAD